MSAKRKALGLAGVSLFTFASFTLSGLVAMVLTIGAAWATHYAMTEDNDQTN
jgi:hypothetical protein